MSPAKTLSSSFAPARNACQRDARLCVPGPRPSGKSRHRDVNCPARSLYTRITCQGLPYLKTMSTIAAASPTSMPTGKSAAMCVHRLTSHPTRP